MKFYLFGNYAIHLDKVTYFRFYKQSDGTYTVTILYDGEDSCYNIFDIPEAEVERFKRLCNEHLDYSLSCMM